VKSTQKSAGKVTIDAVKFQRLRKDLRECANLRVQVGVLGQKNARTKSMGSPEGNAEIGVIHEFGRISENIPRRSFLYDPLSTELGKAVVKEGTSAWRNHAILKGFKSVMNQLGILSVRVVDQAFATAGYGKWPANSPMTIALKGSSSPLIDTAQLRQSS